MLKYLLLQFKRVLKLLPYVGVTALVLFSGLVLILNGIVEMFSSEQSDAKVRIAIVGQAEDSYLEMGLAALQTIDSSRYTIEVMQMEESTARSALERGEIAAYVVIPEGFTEAALDGKVLTLDYVSTVGARGLVSMFKDEITHVIEDIVLACQRGMYGVEGTFDAAGIGGAGKHINKLSISYVELVLARSHTYEVRELGIHNKLGLEGYLFSGICIVLFALSVLPFGQLLIKGDLSLCRLLASKRCGSIAQSLADFFSFCIGFIAVLLVAFGIVTSSMGLLALDLRWLFGGISIAGVMNLVFAIFVVASFAYMFYSFSGNMVGGILLQFFASVCMCFAGGCMYPITFFPDKIQRIAQVLPHSIARTCVSDFLLGKISGRRCLMALGYGVCFISIAVLTHRYRVKKVRG